MAWTCLSDVFVTLQNDIETITSEIHEGPTDRCNLARWHEGKFDREAGTLYTPGRAKPWTWFGLHKPLLHS